MSGAPTAIYLDHQATTPVDPRVLDVMWPWFSETFGNAHSEQHVWGRQAAEAVEVARAKVASLIGAEAREIVFYLRRNGIQQSGDQGRGAICPASWSRQARHHRCHRA